MASGQINLANSTPTLAATFTAASRSRWKRVFVVLLDQQLGLLVDLQI
jgi:hypothetical protein